MDVPRVDSAQLRLASTQMLADTAVDLVRGDRFAATVVAIHEAGEIILATPRGSFISQTDVRLAPGQSLVLEVARGGASPLLRIVDGAFHFDEQAFAEAVIEAFRRRVLADRVARLAGPPRDMRQIATALRAQLNAPGSPLTAEQRTVAARLLAPLDPRASANEMSAHLRALIEDGGTLLEPRLRTALAGRAPAGALPADVAHDLRVVLGAMLEPGTDDTARAGARQRLTSELATEVLARQLDQALQWVRHGTLVADVPLGEHYDDRVRMQYERDAPDGDAGNRAPGHVVRLAFDLETFGPLDVLVNWAHGTASVHLRVRDEATRARLADGLADLRAALRARGLALDRADVEVGPPDIRVVDTPSEPPPSGTILRLVG